MKIECSKEKLTKALSKAEKVTGKNTTLPVLSCFLFKAEKESLLITATNLDLGIEISIPVKVIEEGTVAVPAQILTNFVSNVFSDKDITLETDGNNLKISTQNSNTTIKTFSVEDFPVIPMVGKENSFSIPSKEFIKGLKNVYYAASTSTIKPTLSSVYIYPQEDFLVFAATDSFRLAEKRIKLKKTYDFSQILLPLKNVSEVIKVFEDINADISVSVDKNQISFEHDGIYLTSRVIDGTFPDYKQIIPKEFKTEVTILKYDLMNVLKMSNIFADKFSQIYINVSEKPKLFEIKTKNNDIGENVSNIEAIVKGDSLSMSFNYKYIIDCFQSIESDSITLQFVDNTRAMVVRGASDKSYLYLVMPMNK
jgi:DNA polymerase III subunit beta